MTSLITPKAISCYVISHDKILLIRRNKAYLQGTWQMVTGGIEPGETAFQAAYREILEETSLVPDRLYSADTIETFYMKAMDKIWLMPVFVAILDTVREVKLSKEHDAYEWVSFEEAKKRVVWAEQKRILAHVYEYFIANEPNPINLVGREDEIYDPI